MTMKNLGALLVAAVFAIACSDPTMPTRTLVSDAATAAITPHPIQFINGGTWPANTSSGVIRLCKSANAAGSFAFTMTVNGGVPAAIPGGPIVLGAAGTACRNVYTSTVGNQGVAPEVVVISEAADQTDWELTGVDIDQYYGAFVSYPSPRLDSDDDDLGGRSATVYINDDMVRIVTFTNTYTAPPPPQVCDFITFGRLVWQSGGLKVVISGNAGGFNADGSIKGEFHIEVNDVDHHVADVDAYGPIAAAPLASGTYANSRYARGVDKHGHDVELRLWDGGEPGRNTDRFWFSVNGSAVGNAVTGNLIDQGNMQYHPICRGPDVN
ncbi:MAG TPA: hypothetical protein VFZ73_01795 [Gemmatimonadaceae bacterium]